MAVVSLSLAALCFVAPLPLLVGQQRAVGRTEAERLAVRRLHCRSVRRSSAGSGLEAEALPPRILQVGQ